MKSTSPALLAYLNAARAGADVGLLMADGFIFTLRSGLVLCYTNIDLTFSYNGRTFLGNSILISGLKYKASIGLEVDQQQITVSARSTDTIAAGAPFLQALRDGAFDGCEIASSSPIGWAVRQSARSPCSRGGSARSTRSGAPARS